MSKILKSIFPKTTLQIRAFKLLIWNKNSFLWKSGWMKSVERVAPINANEEPIPWMNYSFIKFLTPRIKKDFHLFEYGSGNSTFYFAKLVSQIVSVEHDSGWFDLVKSNLPSNATLLYKEKDLNGNYSKTAVETGKKFHIIVVDAIDRMNCLFNSVDALREDGILILDDSHSSTDSDDLDAIFNFFEDRGFKSLTIYGPKPFSLEFVSATIFYKKENCLNI